MRGFDYGGILGYGEGRGGECSDVILIEVILSDAWKVARNMVGRSSQTVDGLCWLLRF